MKVTRENLFSNFIWRYAERCGAQLVAFIVALILARILNPAAYGTIALINVFTAILQIFVDSGLGNALIQKKDADETDFSTVFYANILFCFFLYALLFVGAPIIAAFYGDSDMTMMLRVLGLTVVISGVKNVQQAYVSKNMLFKHFFFSTLGGTICSAIIGIIMAYRGYGVWALIAQNLINVTIDTLILWVTVKWRPKKVFSLASFEELFSYGWKLTVASLMDTGYSSLQDLIIGRIYTPADLGAYNQGNRLPNLVMGNINTSIDSILLPAMSNVQDKREYVKKITRKSIMISIYIIAPLMMGIASIAEPLIRLLFTDKWMVCIPYLRIFCVSYMFWPMHTANLNAMRALGRSDLILKLQLIKCCIEILSLIVTAHVSVVAIAYGLMIMGFVGQVLNAWPNKNLLEYKYTEQMRDILPSIIMAVVMGAGIYPICFLKIPDIVILIIQVILGMTVYIGLSFIFQKKILFSILENIKFIYIK